MRLHSLAEKLTVQNEIHRTLDVVQIDVAAAAVDSGQMKQIFNTSDRARRDF